jgi:hypothetical protein
MPIIQELIVRNAINPMQETAPIPGTNGEYYRYFKGSLNAAILAIR